MPEISQVITLWQWKNIATLYLVDPKTNVHTLTLFNYFWEAVSVTALISGPHLICIQCHK
jgi:hypothetical protein